MEKIIIAAIVLAFLAGFVTSYVVFRDRPQPIAQTDTIYVDKPLDITSLPPATQPDVVTIYKPGPERIVEIPVKVPETFIDTLVVRDTLTQFVERSLQYNFQGITDESVHLKHDRLDIYAWDFNAGSWIQKTYKIPKKKFDLFVDIKADIYGVDDVFLSLAPGIKWNRHELAIGPTFNPVSGKLTIGVTTKLRF